MLKSALITFSVVAQYGSFHKAAEKLYLSPVAVMKQINRLEDELGFLLFLRTNRGIQITPAGKIFLEDVLFLQNYAEKSIQKARRTASAVSHVIRVGDSLLRPCRPLIDLWNSVNDYHSRYKLRIVPFNDDAESLNRVFHTFGKDFDILYGVCDITNWKKHFQSLEICRKKFCISVPIKHSLASRSHLNLTDLYGERLVVISPGTSAIIDEIHELIETKHPQILLENAPPHFDIHLFNRCVETDTLLLTVEAWENLHPSLRSIPVNLDYTMPYGIMYPLNPSDDISMFIQLIRTHLNTMVKAIVD